MRVRNIIEALLVLALVLGIASFAKAQLPKPVAPVEQPKHWPLCSQWHTEGPWTVLKRGMLKHDGVQYEEWRFDRDGDGEMDLAALFPVRGQQVLPYPTQVYVDVRGERRLYGDMVGFGLCKDYVDITDQRGA